MTENDNESSRPRWSKTDPDSDTTTTVFHRRDQVLMLECSVFPFSKHDASHLNQKLPFWTRLSIRHFPVSLLARPRDL